MKECVVLESGGETGRTASFKTAILGKRLLNLSPGIVLAVAYSFSSIVTRNEAYNLIIAGALVGLSMCIRLVSETALKRIIRYMFLTGVVMGVVGVSPPLYFAITYGILSPTDLIFSIVCIILTLVTISRIRRFNIL